MQRIMTANGDYFLLLAPGGALTEEAIPLFRMAARTGADFIYGDELARDDGGAERPIVKPGPSPDTLLSYNCVGSPLAVSAALLDRVGPPATGSYAERWAFTIRAFFSAVFPLHLPRVMGTGKYDRPVPDAAVIRHALLALHRRGEAYPVPSSGCVSVRYACPPDTLLSVVAAASDRPEALRSTLESIELHTAETRLECIVADGGMPDERKAAYYGALERCGVKLMRQWHEPNVARLYNLAAREAKGEALIFLRAGDTVGSEDAFRYMLEFAMQPHVGAVGAADGGARREPVCARNVRRLSGALMLSRDMLILAGGFDESFATAGCETALSVTLRERRRQLIVTPEAVIRRETREETPDEKNRLRLQDYSL